MKTIRRKGVIAALILLTLLVGCAKYNTYYNAKRAFDQAEQVREDAIRNHEEPRSAQGAQKTNYETAIRKAQKVLDEYPGHDLTDDALFLQGKAHYRLEAYRQSIRKLDLLFVNFPQTPYLEESYYLQALNYLLLGDAVRSQEYLDRLAKAFPESKFLSETLIVSGDNAYALEEWDQAAAAYAQYLDEFPESEDRDRIGMKLANCYWELKQYEKADEVLRPVGQSAESAELAFRARLLQARVNIKLGDFAMAGQLLSILSGEAELYEAGGSVRIVEAEKLIAEGKGDEATSLLENLPEEWRTPLNISLAADLLGYLYVERGDWDQALEQFKAAVRRRDDLDDKERTRLLKDNLQDYITAEEGLANASGARVPRLKLLQANAMLFGFDRPAEAGRLYQEAAADTAADSTVAARGLYGTVVVYRNYLDKPDSADIFAQQLQDRYPESPQAFDLGREGDVSLLQYLLTQQAEQQAEHYAGLSEEELRDLVEINRGGSGAQTAGAHHGPGLRRQMVYFSRRPNLTFEPPAFALARAADRMRDQPPPGAEDAPRGGPGGPDGPGGPGGPGGPPPRGSRPGGGPASAAADTVAGAEPPPVQTENADATVQPDEATGAEEQEGDKEEEKKDEKRNWEFDLR